MTPKQADKVAAWAVGIFVVIYIAFIIWKS